MASRLAIYHPAGQVGLKQNPFGADVANLELYQALARHAGLTQLDILSNQPVSAEAVSEALFEGRPHNLKITTGALLQQTVAAEAGALLRGKADLGEMAWLRRRRLGDRAFSLIGLVHTIAPPAIREYIGMSAVAPTQPWDALICTSPAVQSALTAMFDEWGGYLAERFGGGARPRPQLPLVPLGVDLDRLSGLADRPDARAAARAELGIGPDEAMVLWVGRLSFYEKAFPQPMFRAVAEAARATGVRTHFVMAGWFPGGDRDRGFYEGAARAYAPDTPVHVVDGNDRKRLGELWAGADVFLSLVDNIQETFGITPLEAMAARLPVVVSDWDGYRYTVADGEVGFLIPTLGSPPGGLGSRLADAHIMSLESYQTYVGSVAQHTAVDVGRAAEALAALIARPDLRRQMGQAGRARVRSLFDWPVVARQVAALVDDLAAVRAAAADPSRAYVQHPLKGDPFRDFQGFASRTLTLDTILSVRPGVTAADVLATRGRPLDEAFGFWRADADECARALGVIAATPAATARDVLMQFPVDRRRSVELGLVWMAKLGFIAWR